MDWIVDIFRNNQAIPIFLTLGIGFWIGNLKFKSFSLGPVTATLIVGVIMGQMDIEINELVKSLAFMLFLFAIGYNVGPQFFRSLRGDGLKQILFAVIEVAVCVGCVVGVCSLMGYNKGVTVGMFAGSQTISAVIGVGTDTIRALGLPPDETDKMVSMIPACYAVTYIFGTIGSAWLIANFGPVLLGGLKKVKAETKALEAEMDSKDFAPTPGYDVANRPISFRAYKVEAPYFNKPRSVDEIERHIKGMKHRHFIERLRLKGEIFDPEPELKVRMGDIVVLSGRRESIVDEAGWIGSEVTDHELLNFTTENLPVTVSKSGADGITIGELKQKEYMRGVLVNKLKRNDISLPARNHVQLQKGDVITLVGLPQDVAVATPEIGYSDRSTEQTDIVFISLGIAIGCFIGALTVYFDGIPISLSTSGGAILAGLLMGWWRSKHPTFGHIPRSVTWFMDNLGLNLFIAVVGIMAGPTFIEGIKEVGIPLFFIGIVCTAFPIILCIFIGNKIFKFPAAVTLGCVAGGRNAVAALGAIQDSLDSDLPVMGYTVTYAVSSLLLILAGIVVALLA